MTDLTFLMPAWNEERGIRRAVETAIEAGERLIRQGEIERFEVIVVDDGSTDRTAEILDRSAAEDDRVGVCHRDRNGGLGASLRTGFAAAEGAVVLYTDSDLPFDLFETGRALRLMRSRDAAIVAAYRHDRTSEGPRRALYSLVYNLLVRVLFGLRVRDVNFAAKLIRAEVLDDVEIESNGSFVDAELLTKADAAGHGIIQIGVDYFPRSRGVSTLSSTAVVLEMLREMASIGPGIRRGTRQRSRSTTGAS